MNRQLWEYIYDVKFLKEIFETEIYSYIILEWLSQNGSDVWNLDMKKKNLVEFQIFKFGSSFILLLLYHT